MADTLFVNATATVPGTPIVAPWMNDVNTATYDHLSSVVGTNAVVANGPLSMTAYATGQNFYFVPTGANTGATTISINGLGARSITKNGAVALAANDLVVGSEAHIVYDGTRFQLINPQTIAVTGITPVANGGTGASNAQAAKTNLLIPPAGQCYMTTSGANIILLPEGGRYLTINGVQEVIPAAGVTLAPTGAAASTRYYIYAFMNAGIMTLEYATTVPVMDTASGVMIKTGDVTRTLVGQSSTNTTAGAWQNSGSTINVLSWFNRRPRSVRISLTGNIGTTSVPFVELDPTYRVSVAAWNGSAVHLAHSGAMNCNAVATINIALSVISGSVSLPNGVVDGGSTAATIASANYQANACVSAPMTATADGVSFIGLLGATAAGTMAVLGSVSPGQRCNIMAVTYG